MSRVSRRTGEPVRNPRDSPPVHSCRSDENHGGDQETTSWPKAGRVEVPTLLLCHLPIFLVFALGCGSAASRRVSRNRHILIRRRSSGCRFHWEPQLSQHDLQWSPPHKKHTIWRPQLTLRKLQPSRSKKLRSSDHETRSPEEDRHVAGYDRLATTTITVPAPQDKLYTHGPFTTTTH